MKIFLLLLILLISSALSSHHQTDIIELNENNLDKAIAKYQKLFILFDAKWCTESQQAVKAMEKFAKAHSVEIENEMKVTLGIYKDADKDEDLRAKYDIDGYPHIALFMDGAQIKFDEIGFSKSSYLDFLQKKADSYSHEVKNLEELKNYIEEKEHVVLYFGSKSHARYKFFVEASHKFDTLFFTYADNPYIQDEYTLLRDNIYILKKNGKHEQFRKAWKRDRLMNWIYLNTYPPAKILDDDLLDKILYEQSPAIVLFLEAKEPSLQTFFEENHDLYYETHYGAICLMHSKICKKFIKEAGLSVEPPTIKALNFHPSSDQPLSFSYPHEEINRQVLSDWLKALKKGSQMMDVKSQPLPPFSSQSSLLKQVNFEHFHELFDAKKDLFLFFRPSNCPDPDACATLRSNLEMVASTMKANGDDHIFFGEFDLEANSHFGLFLKNEDEPYGPFVRYYKRYETQEAQQVDIKELSSVKAIINFILDLSSEDIHYVKEYEQDI